MDHGLHHGDDGHMTMEYIERRETPACGPEKYIISTGKNPQERKVCEGNNPGAISYVPEELLVYGRPARKSARDRGQAANVRGHTIDCLQKLDS